MIGPRPALVLLACAALPLSACGLQPLYAGGASGYVVTEMAAIDVPAIPGREGWLVRNALNDRLGRGDAGGAQRYRLDVVLDDTLEGLGLLTDDTIGRQRRTLRARYQLVDTQSGAILLDATAGSDAGIDVVGSEFATIAAEQTALENLAQEVADQILIRVTRTLREGQ